MPNDLDRRRFAAAALVAFACAAGGATASRAQAMDPAAQRIESYYATLLPAVTAARGLGVAERARRISSAVRGAFDIGAMTELAVGPAWSRFSAAERSQTIEAFGEFIVADYASQLGDYLGEGYKVEPAVVARGGDQIVKSRIGSTEIDYRMRGARILDIYANGTVSELAARRAEFASILASTGGAEGLIRELRQRTGQLLGG